MNIKSVIQALEGKAIPAHPALRDLGSVPVHETGRPSGRKSYLGKRNASRHMNMYGGGVDASDWVMDCLGLIAETAAAADFHLEQDGEKLLKSTDTKPKTGTAKQVPPMLDLLLERPNPFMLYAELIELALIDYFLTGDAYWLKWQQNDAQQPLALYRLAPPLVEVLPGPFGVEGYRYKVPGFDPVEFPADAVIHFRRANPHSPFHGLGVIQGGARMLDLELALTDTQAAYFENRAQPSIVVESDRRVPDDVFRKLKREIAGKFGGRNSGMPMVLEAGLKYQAVSPSAAEARFAELATLSRDRIAALFRVPLALLGVTEGNSQAKLTDAQRIFDTKTMRPLLDRFQDAITHGLTRAWGLEFKIEYDYIMPIEDRIKLTSTFSAIPGVRIVEVREYAGLPPLGDDRDTWVLNLPGDNGTAANPTAGHPDRALAGEPGRPPNPSRTKVIPKNANNLPSTSTVSTKAFDDIIEVLEGKARELGQGDNVRELPRINDTLGPERVATVDEIVAETQTELNDAARVLRDALVIEGKANKASDAWIAFRKAITTALERAARTAVAQGVMHAARSGHQADDEIDYEAVAREIVHRPDGIRGIVATLKERVANGGAADAIDAWIGSQSETVALTDATHAYNEGALSFWEAAGLANVHVLDGDEHDDACREANGQTWPINKARANRLEHPRCRRAFAAATI